MGNRASIVLPEHKLSIYLHWNGGPESVAAFLKYAHDMGVRNDDYYPARLLQIIGNFFGGTNSLGVSALTDEPYDYGDNGIYTVRLENRNEPEIKHNNHASMTLTEFIQSVEKDSYWLPSEDETIMETLAKINDPFFKGK